MNPKNTKNPLQGIDKILVALKELVSSGALPANAAVESKQDAQITALSNLLLELQNKADLTETQPVSQVLGSSSVRTDVPLNTSTVTLKAANTNRKSLLLHNGSDVVMYVAYGTGATTSDYTLPIYPTQSFEITNTTEEITAIWANSGTGSCFITEIT